jgi:DNA-binding XRE family transcriptional regulator
VPTHPPSKFELCRRAAGLTQAELGDVAGVSRATVQMCERGYRPVDATQRRIANALGVDVAELWPDVRMAA